eukprot:3518301-Amphidinium_carterae.1
MSKQERERKHFYANTPFHQHVRHTCRNKLPLDITAMRGVPLQHIQTVKTWNGLLARKKIGGALYLPKALLLQVLTSVTAEAIEPSNASLFLGYTAAALQRDQPSSYRRHNDEDMGGCEEQHHFMEQKHAIWGM